MWEKIGNYALKVYERIKEFYSTPGNIGLKILFSALGCFLFGFLLPLMLIIVLIAACVFYQDLNSGPISGGKNCPLPPPEEQVEPAKQSQSLKDMELRIRLVPDFVQFFSAKTGSRS